MKKQTKPFKFYKKIVAFFYGKVKFHGLENIPEEPSLIIGNHAQAHGTFMAELYFPGRKGIWCIGTMMDKKLIPEYAKEDWWKYKKKKSMWFYNFIARLLAPLVAYVHNRAKTIAVWHDARAINTFKNTVKVLKEGCNVIIFPEHHVPYNDIVNEFQDKFIDVARLYYKNTGKCLSFVPMYTAPMLRSVYLGKPIKYDPAIEIEAQRDIIRTYLVNEITAIAKSLPPHKVVPYANVSKKDYPMSRPETPEEAAAKK